MDTADFEDGTEHNDLGHVILDQVHTEAYLGGKRGFASFHTFKKKNEQSREKRQVFKNYSVSVAPGWGGGGWFLNTLLQAQKMLIPMNDVIILTFF